VRRLCLDRLNLCDHRVGAFPDGLAFLCRYDCEESPFEKASGQQTLKFSSQKNRMRTKWGNIHVDPRIRSGLWSGRDATLHRRTSVKSYLTGVCNYHSIKIRQHPLKRIVVSIKAA
jgi:hypothetical protein